MRSGETIRASIAEGRSVRVIAEAPGISVGSVHGMLKAPARAVAAPLAEEA